MIVIGVSGGVDSVVLLHKISKNLKPGDIVVAHIDHGVRTSSASDAAFVKQLCTEYGVKFELKELELGRDFSEEQGRIERYTFLENIRQKYGAEHIVTAHHKDDFIETAVINLMRGTGRRGLSALKNTSTIKRPLLSFFKKELLDYAKDNNLDWVEDSSNKDTKFLRNKIRLELIPSAIAKDPEFKSKFLQIIQRAQDLNREIDRLLERLVERRWPNESIDKDFIKGLDEQLIKELVLYKAREAYGEYYLSKERLEAAADFVKTNTTGKQLELNGRLSLFIEKSVISLKSTV